MGSGRNGERNGGVKSAVLLRLSQADAPVMASLDLVLFGGFQACAGGHSVDVPGRKERGLLAILALPPGELRSRDKLAGLLWSDRGDKQAHDSLKSAIARLKQAFGSLNPLPVVSSRDCLCLDRERVVVDVAVFERLLGEATPDSIAQATALYRGDLLDGLDIRDPAFEEWLLLERNRLRILAREALGAVLDQRLASGARDGAAAVAHRLLALDPLREAAHRALMQIYAEQGQTTLALKQYQLCRDVLQRELAVGPEPETERLYRSIRERRTTTPIIGQSPRPELAAAPVGPTIAVLAFANMSGDPEQQYFSDGITEDIIAELSRFRQLLVIARNSTFQYRGQSVDVRTIGRDLGAQYVVEGSVRKLADRVRITAQLIEAATGNHIWSERYDRSLEDIFVLQDEVVRSIVTRIEGRLAASMARHTRRTPTQHLGAYDCMLRGREHIAASDGAAGEPLLRRAVELDSDYAQAYAWLAVACHLQWLPESGPELLDDALAHARRAVALDGADALCQCALGEVHMLRREFDVAGIHFERAMALNPNDTLILAVYCGWLSSIGRHADALAGFDTVLQRDPFPPSWYWDLRASALLDLRRYEEALAALQRTNSPTLSSRAHLAACHSHLGNMRAAHAAADEVRHQRPTFSIGWFVGSLSLADSSHAEPLREGLRKAGLPD
jgi:TolB-like protein/Tfp pilus assembly protein PilF